MSAPTPEETARTRLRAIGTEVEQLRGHVPIPALQAAPLPAARVHRLMDLLSEAAVHHVRLHEFDEARRAIADAILCMQDVVDGAAIARASLLTGEALVELDSPKHAKTRLDVAVSYYDKIGDAKLLARSRTALSRAMILLDDPEGLALLRAVHADLLATGEAAMLARVETLLHEAINGGNPAETVRAGYGRAVSIPPGRTSLVPGRIP